MSAAPVPLAVMDAKLDKLAAKVTAIDDCYSVVEKEEDFDSEGNRSPGYLGRGTFGVVKRMVKKTGGAPVAVKELEKRRISTMKQFKHTLIEIAVMKSLNHPGCLRLHEVLHTSTSIYLVTTLCEGELYDFIQAARRLPVDKTQIIMKQLLGVLGYLHGAGIIHRDVKPENILINPQTLVIKLIDFGMAKFVPKPQPQQHLNHFPQTHDGRSSTPAQYAESPVVAVTPFTCTEFYASYEAIQGMLESTTEGKTSWYTSRRNLPKVDVYGAGVVCYAMMIGCLPYHTEGIMQQKPDVRLRELKELMKGGLRFPSWARSLPKQGLEFVSWLLNHDASRRPTALEAMGHPFVAGIDAPVQPVTPGFTVMKQEKVAEGSKVLPSREVPTDLTAPPPRKKKGKKKEGVATPETPPRRDPSPATPAPIVPEVQQAEGDPSTPASKDSEEFIFKDPPSDVPSPADRTNFKDGWGSIMRNVRQGEDSDVEG